MARRRRITSAESRKIRILVFEQGVSQREALRRFRAAGFKIADSIFRELYAGLKQGFRGNINRLRGGIPFRVSVVPETTLERLGREIGDTLASTYVTVVGKGFSTGVARLSLEGRSYDVPWTTQTVTVHFGITADRLGEVEAKVRDAINFKTASYMQRRAALEAVKKLDTGLVEAAKRYGRLALVGSPDTQVTSITVSRGQAPL